MLCDHLLDLSYTNITVLDISQTEIVMAKERLGEKADRVRWIISDAADFVCEQSYDIWDDHAAFHFLASESDMKACKQTVASGIASNGLLIGGTFSENGPQKCSGINIKQYSQDVMKSEFRDGFDPIECFTIDHHTPFDTVQNFTFLYFQETGKYIKFEFTFFKIASLIEAVIKNHTVPRNTLKW